MNALRELILNFAPVQLIAAMIRMLECDVNKPNFGFTLLMDALRHYPSAHVEVVVRNLLCAGADPNASSIPSRSRHFITPRYPLHEAAAKLYLSLVRLLLDYGADPYLADDLTGMRAIHWARHAHVAFPKNAGVRKTVTFLEALDECRDAKERLWPALQRELMEAAWHPARLQKLRYFEADE